MFPPEFQEVLDFLQQLPFYVRLITVMSVVSVVLTTLVGVGVIIQLNRLIAALRSSRGDLSGSSPHHATAAPPSSTAPPSAPYGPATTPYGSAGPYGQSGGSSSGTQSPWS